MKIVKRVLTYLFGAFMIFGGINHFLKPAMYFPFFPDYMPKEILNYLTGIIEIMVGIGVFIPKYRKKASFGILILMVLFLPFHIWDVFSDKPAIGSHQASLVRLPVQFLFIFLAWFISSEE